MTGTELQELQKNSEDFLPEKLFLRICISTVRESLDQLHILENINKWPKNGNTLDKYKTPEQRFSDMSTNSNVTFNSDKNSALFQKYCVFVQSLLTNLLSELTHTGSYEEFKTALESFKHLKAEEKNLIIASSEKEKEVLKLQTMLSAEKTTFIEQILNCMADIGKIKDDIENFQVEGGMNLKYIKAWENAQIEMSDIITNQKQQEKREHINRTNADINQEERVHKEILLAYNWFQKELESELEEWKQKYTTDMKKMNVTINTLQEKEDQQLEKIRNMRELFAKRQKEIEDYKEYKIEQEKLRKEIEKNVKAATKIQAWWRGTMVRKGFGKYRKKKEKKVKKKSSEKKSAM